MSLGGQESKHGDHGLGDLRNMEGILDSLLDLETVGNMSKATYEFTNSADEFALNFPSFNTGYGVDSLN
jgi:hypothetical protein